MVLAIGTPALLLPDVSVSSQEITLIVAGLAAAFTLFEYAATHPGLMDFRFAPPYNRIRFFAFASQILALTFLCRAHAGVDGFDGFVARYTNISVALGSWPYSPVNLIMARLPEGVDAGFAEFVRQASSVSLVLSVGLMTLFGFFLWFIRWPVMRRDFNLWINLPTFAPGYAADVERRLFRDGVVNFAIGVAFIYAAPLVMIPYLELNASAWRSDLQLVLWSVAIWGFVASSLIVRGMALMKIWWLVRNVRVF